MERNIALLKKVRRVVKMHPERHQQDVWYGSRFGGLMGATVEKLRKFAFMPLPEEPAAENGFCGTTACVAGWAAIFAAPKGTTLTGDYEDMVLPSGERISVCDYAADALGLDYDETATLFSAYLERDDVLRYLDTLIAGGNIYRD